MRLSTELGRSASTKWRSTFLSGEALCITPSKYREV
jgi:hypothetical protein